MRAALPLVLFLAACSDSGTGPHGHAGEPVRELSTEIVTDRSTATVMGVAADGRFVTLDHDPLPGIDMGAMRMGLDVADGVDVSDLAEGDRVEFAVEAGDSIGIRVTDICVPAREGGGCLAPARQAHALGDDIP